ncbi:MAG: GPR endopeptidase [Christensenellales bacterium]|jgi:spore protease
MRAIRTDLAAEAREIYGKDIDGVESFTEPGEIPVSRVKIISRAGEEALGKAQGNYVTIEAKRMRERDSEYERQLMEILAREIRAVLPRMGKGDVVMVVGLGNSDMTPDSLGPRAVSKVMVTRHIFEFLPEQIDERLRPICALKPGVLGITGIETQEIIKGVVERVQPCALVVVDSLAARRTSNISTTVQISDAGISPGAGVGNKRKSINRQELGVPVIAIGVPMVSYAYTIAVDAMGSLVEELGIGGQEQRIEDAAGKVLAQDSGEMVVTPKEIDVIVEDAARIVGNGINLALHDSISLDEVKEFMH